MGMLCMATSLESGNIRGLRRWRYCGIGHGRVLAGQVFVDLDLQNLNFLDVTFRIKRIVTRILSLELVLQRVQCSLDVTKSFLRDRQLFVIPNHRSTRSIPFRVWPDQPNFSSHLGLTKPKNALHSASRIDPARTLNTSIPNVFRTALMDSKLY